MASKKKGGAQWGGNGSGKKGGGKKIDPSVLGLAPTAFGGALGAGGFGGFGAPAAVPGVAPEMAQQFALLSQFSQLF